ncbi:MAG: hypothetical protein KGI71_06445 [Patescibacteria group bacterium]|nr:hypothetical protein [Patescibacteria group bacterium]
MTILGPDSKPLVSDKEQDATAQRRQDLCEKVYALFVHERVTFEEGCDVAANLLVNYITAQPDFHASQQAARQVVGNLTAVFQDILRDLHTRARVNDSLRAANQQQAPS